MEYLIRRAYEDVLDILLEDKKVTFIAPTGYGKSKGTPYFKKELEREWNLPRIVHAFPLRSLVQSQLNYLSSLNLRPCHASGLPLEGKCPYMSGEMVVATIDYLSLVINRLPPPELPFVMRRWSYGHYEYPRSNLFTSMIVLDEAHLIGETWDAESSHGRDFLSATLEILDELEVPHLVTTATLPSKFITEFLRGKVVAVCKNCYSQLGDKVVRVNDEEYYGRYGCLKWDTRLSDDTIEKYVGKTQKWLIDEASRGKVLIVTNTVSKAISLYESMRELPSVSSHLNEDEIVLVHGRLSSNDKIEAVKRIDNAKIVISTQVIEAGVDVDATVLITEGAPPSSLAQRSGRLCRIRECEEAKVVITKPGKEPYGSISEKTVEAINEVISRGKQIQWRLLDDDNGKSYVHLIDVLESELKSSSEFRSMIELAITTPFPEVKEILKVLKRHCSFVRDTNLVTVKVDEDDYVEVSLGWLVHKLHSFAVNGKVKVTFDKGDSIVEEEVSIDELKRLLKGNECSGYYEFLEKRNALSAQFHGEELYERGVGLIA